MGLMRRLVETPTEIQRLNGKHMTLPLGLSSQKIIVLSCLQLASYLIESPVGFDRLPSID